MFGALGALARPWAPLLPQIYESANLWPAGEPQGAVEEGSCQGKVQSPLPARQPFEKARWKEKKEKKRNHPVHTAGVLRNDSETSITTKRKGPSLDACLFRTRPPFSEQRQ